MFVPFPSAFLHLPGHTGSFSHWLQRLQGIIPRNSIVYSLVPLLQDTGCLQVLTIVSNSWFPTFCVWDTVTPWDHWLKRLSVGSFCSTCQVAVHLYPWSRWEGGMTALWGVATSLDNEGSYSASEKILRTSLWTHICTIVPQGLARSLNEAEIPINSAIWGLSQSWYDLNIIKKLIFLAYVGSYKARFITATLAQDNLRYLINLDQLSPRDPREASGGSQETLRILSLLTSMIKGQ